MTYAGTVCMLLLMTRVAMAGQAQWPTYHGQPSLEGVSPTAFSEKPDCWWNRRIGRRDVSAPVAGEHLFCIVDHTNVVALSRTGQQLWARRILLTASNDAQTAAAVFAAPPYACGDVAVLAEEGGMVFALDAESGRERWRRPAGDRILAPPTGWITSDGRQRILVLNQPDGDVHALDAEAGTTLWTREGSARSDGPVSTDGQRIVHGTCAATLCVLAADDGTTLYTVPLGTGHEVAGGIALADGRAYGGTRGGDLFCADLETGAVVWRRAGHAADMFNTPAVDKERVVYSAGEAVYAVDLENGHPLWEQSLGTGPVGSPVTDGKTIVVAVGGRMVMLDAEDGRPVWHREVSDSMAGPAAVEGVLVVGTDDGFVVAFGEERRATDARTP